MRGDDIFDAIIQNYHTLTKLEVHVADYILAHRQAIPHIAISALSEACGVSDATITRFCRTLGYGSFREFKLAIVQALSYADSAVPVSDTDVYREISAEDTLQQKCQKLYRIETQALAQTFSLIDYDKIDQAVDLFCQADNIYCFGQGNSSMVAMDAWGRFVSVTSKFHWVTDYHMQAFTAATLGPKDIILYFSFSGAMRELSELGHLVRQTEGKLILVTRFPNSPGAQYADLLLICGANEAPNQQGSIAVKLGQLFIIDILFHEFCARNPETTKLNRERTLNASDPMLL